MDSTIRLLEPSDNTTIAAIIRSTLVEFKANHPGTVYYDASTDALFQLFQHPHSIYFIAELEGKIVGGAGVFPTEGLPADTCELVKMYLLPQARGRGLGRELIERCMRFAKEQGFRNIYLETMPELANAVVLYEKMGFVNLEGAMGNTGHSGCHIWMIRELS